MQNGKSPLENRRLLCDPVDIRALLEKLQRRRSRVAAYYDNKQNSFSTYILDVSDAGVVFHNPCDPAVSGRILESNSLLFNSICSTAPVNFVASKIETFSFEGQDALRIALPTSIHWIQRRSAERFRHEEVHNIICEITFKNGQISKNPLSDISLGGLGLLSNEITGHISTGTEFSDCHIVLPNHTRLRSTLRVCSSTSTTTNKGEAATRLGFQFLKLSEHDQLQLQQYIQELL